MDSLAKSAGDLVQDVGGLVTLPDVYLRINRLMEDPNSSSADIAEAVSRDPAFTLRLLRVANSPLYKVASSVDTVAKAVTLLGTAQIRNLALTMSVANSFAGLPNNLVSMENFWRHSLLCALAARLLAKEARRCDAEALFTAGLLHDIGELILFNRLPEQSKDAVLLVQDSSVEMSIHDAEHQISGIDHAEVGGELARKWQLPSLLEECIAYHHDIGKAKRHPREAALIHIANIVAQMAEIDSLDPADSPPIDPAAWKITGLTDQSIEPVVREVQAMINEVESLFMGKT
jgi:putative nucleotidyltransferase with HDIG domain